MCTHSDFDSLMMLFLSYAHIRIYIIPYHIMICHIDSIPYKDISCHVMYHNSFHCISPSLPKYMFTSNAISEDNHQIHFWISHPFSTFPKVPRINPQWEKGVSIGRYSITFWVETQPRDLFHEQLRSFWYQSCKYGLLKHWGRDKMAAISQTTLSNAFSWMKILDFTEVCF